MYILDKYYREGKYTIGENKIIGGKAYIKDEEIRSAPHWHVSRTDWNIVYYLTKELEYLESWDNCYYASAMEEAKKIVKEHSGEDIRIYFETCNEEKINIEECTKGTAMGVWHEVFGIQKIIRGKYTIVYLSGW